MSRIHPERKCAHVLLWDACRECKPYILAAKGKRRRRPTFCGYVELPGGGTYLCKLRRGHDGIHRGSAKPKALDRIVADDLPF